MWVYVHLHCCTSQSQPKVTHVWQYTSMQQSPASHEANNSISPQKQQHSTWPSERESLCLGLQASVSSISPCNQNRDMHMHSREMSNKQPFQQETTCLCLFQYQQYFHKSAFHSTRQKKQMYAQQKNSITEYLKIIFSLQIQAWEQNVKAALLPLFYCHHFPAAI